MSVLTSLAPVSVIAYALNLLLHLTVICLVILCATRWFFRRDPAVRHSLCLTGLVCLLLAPVAVGLEAKAGIGLITLALPTDALAQPIATSKERVLSPADKPYRVAISATLPTQPATAWGGWALLAAYLVGVSWGALRFVHGCRTAGRLKQDVSPWREPSDSVTLRTVAQALHAPVPPVFTSPHVASPIAIGLLHPAVILPDGLSETLSPQQLRHVLLHECAHVAFRHGLGGLLERIAGVLFWPHPLVRALCRELARAREEVCDNFASQEDGAPCYARTLLMVAQGIDTAPNLASTLALLGTGTSLEARIAGLLDPRRNRMVSIKRWKLWAVTGTAIFAMGSTAAIRVVAAQENGGQTPGGVLPGENAVTRIFAFQFIDANQAAEILYNSLSAQQVQQIDLAVDSRTNSIIVQSSGKQMIAIATLFKQIEEQAALERAQQEQAQGTAEAAARIAKQRAEAEAQLAQAQQAEAQARATFTTQNRVQSNPVPTPQTSAQTRSAAVAKSAPVPARPSQAPAQKIRIHTTTSGTTISNQKSLPNSTVPHGKSTQQPVRWIYKISQPALQIVPDTIILKSADAKSVKKLFTQPATPAQTPSQNTSGAPSKTSATVSQQQIDKAIRDRTALYQLELRGATVQLDTAASDKVLIEKFATVPYRALVNKAADERAKVDVANQELQRADAVDQTKTLKAEYDRLTVLQMAKDADEKRAALEAARALEEAARRNAEKNPK